MNIFIDNRSDEPIYNQIYRRMREMILDGEIDEDQALPSIRTLARDLRISVITTKRAYDELEKEGYIYTVPGKGSYAARRNRQLIKEQGLVEIEAHLDAVHTLALRCGLTKQQLKDMLDLLWE
ncbi:MAG: GntR family transcriptional regulator [Eubacteriales bacterium]